MNSGARANPETGAVAAHTAAVLTAVLAATAVALGAALTRQNAGIGRVDPKVAADVLDLRDPALTHLAQVLTFLGSEPVVGGAAFVLMVVLFLRRQVVAACTVAVAMAGSVALTVVLKHLVARNRPGSVDVLGPIDHSYSFPSGHTLNSAVLIAVAAYLVTRRYRQPIAQVVVVCLAVLLEAGIGLSRVYLGYHWASDVLGSWLVALAWLSVVYLSMSVFGGAVGERVSPYVDRVLGR